MTTRILFVDDEPALPRMFVTLFQRLKPQWDVAVAESGKEALALAECSTFDVIVSDMRMPEMNGAQLMNQIRQRYPKTVRIILSAYADQELILECAGFIHQWLSKPCTAVNLIGTIERACELDRRLSSDALKNMVGQIGSLPSLPRWYYRILEELDSPTASTGRIGELIARDLGMTTKLLQLVNSAFFGLAQRVSNPTEAVQLLGVGTVRALAVSIHVFSCFKRQRLTDLDMEMLWNRSLQTAIWARKIVELEHGDKYTAEAAYTAGLLRETGRLILSVNLPALHHQACVRARTQRVPMHQAEFESIGVTHADLGACLLGLWGLPDPIVEAVALQYTPARTAQLVFGPLTALHVVGTFEQHDAMLIAPEIDLDYLRNVGCIDRLEIWKEACKVEEEEAVA